MSLRAGARLGHYSIVSPIGAGGMGEVYRARDPRLGREVAIKVLPEVFAQDPGRLERFTREARAIAALNHPHIVTIYSTEEADGVRFLTMELVEGESLDKLIPAGGLPLARFLDIAVPLADALAAAAQKHITHRDLKPGNLMIAVDGRVKVLDFGLARIDSPHGASDRMVTATEVSPTLAGEVVGTIPYMPPEQLEGKPADQRSDLFSLGIVFYEMLTGVRPFQGESMPLLMAAILKDTPRPLREYRIDAPEALERLICRCLEKRADDRVQTARDVYNELRHLQKQLEPGPVRSSPSPAPPAPERHASIAVLPFADLSAARDQEWFCDGIAEEILNALTDLPGLRVVARTSAFWFRGRTDDLRAIGDKLGVTTVLQGSVRRAGNRVRISVQLVDATNGFQLWSDRYDRELQDIFDIQDEIARAVAARLRLTLAAQTGERLMARRPATVRAYERYLQGRSLLNRRGSAILPALEQFRKAVELDPDYALAWAGIADAYTVSAYFGLIRGEDARAHGLAAARRALALEPLSAEANVALACARLVYEDDREQAAGGFRRGLELNPSYVEGRCWYALFYLQWSMGRFDDGIAEARKALEVDPLSAYVTMILSRALLTAGRHREAVDNARRAVALDPQSFVALWTLGMGLNDAGEGTEAVAVLEQAAAVSNRHHFALLGLAIVHSRYGRPDAARAMYQELVERSSRLYVPLIHLALGADVVGDRERAITLARRSFDEHEPAFFLLARYDSIYSTLRADPRFAALVQSLDEPTKDTSGSITPRREAH